MGEAESIMTDIWVQTWSRLENHYGKNLTGEERVRGLIFSQPDALNNLSGFFYTFYPDDVTPEQHKELPLWRRAMGQLGVACHILSVALAYRQIAQKRRHGSR